MLHDDILFYNVEELVPAADGYALSRIPAAVRAALSDNARDTAAFYSTGVELRFRLTGDEARIYLRADGAERLPALVYYGSFQGGWDCSALAVGTERTCLRIRKSPRLDTLKAIAQTRGMIFDPELVRVVLPYSQCVYLGCDGGVEPPHPGDMPAHRLLSHGSSITHGSLALGNPQCYGARIAHMLGRDHLNLGFAGTCLLEDAMAEYLISRKDWDVMTLEMGVNMLGMDEDAFAERVHSFVRIVSRDARPIFATNLFGLADNTQEKPRRFREIVREAVQGKLHFTDGLALMDDPAMLSEDLVHPSFYAHEQIAARWGTIIRAELNARKEA